ncbi:hypothetical protein [Nocardioides sp. Kera G14]|uniref:hypothetical protein n=1 Tax=Nocardioides sp. Kera G14 TaxID=2884264 RepID=UPI001D101F8B|nr:hypothetical protein [Nocardioides sp. Kera G14]UDY22242.1 hypothetical protein LH076_09105 [Nocardioides sp. Kera G14]
MRITTPIRRTAAALACAGLVWPAAALPAFADDTAPAPSYGGFAASATSTPFRIEVYEPAIPIPASPQAELNFSYTHVEGASGPTSSARASSLWPGAAVGEGLTTIISQAGLPPQLAPANGYPAQVNAAFPGDASSSSQEFFPGMVGRVSASETGAVARAGYSPSGTVAGDETGSTPSASASPSTSAGTSNPLGSLGDGLAALGNALSGKTNGPAPTDSSNPLGALSILVDVGGMSGSSRATYAADSVTATAVGQIGQVTLLGGLVKLEGLTVSSTTVGKVGAATTTPTSTYGRMTILGTPFEFTSDGIVAAGSTTAIPGLSDNPLSALKQLGISLELPKPTRSVDGSTASSSAAGPTLTLDSEPVVSLLSLNKLPLADLVNQLPDSAGQAKGLLLAALEAHPKLVVKLGEVSSKVQIAAPFTADGAGASTAAPAAPAPVAAGAAAAGPASASGPVDTGVAAVPDSSAVDGAAPVGATTLTPVSAAPGLPALGSVPGALLLGGLALAAGAAWWLRKGFGAVFGGAGACSHGLRSGLPDLRKVS